MMQPEEIAHLRKLDAEAIPAPWYVQNDGIELPRIDVVPDGWHTCITHPGVEGDGGVVNRPTAELIVTARNALPALLAELELARRFRAVQGWDRWPTEEQMQEMERAREEHLVHRR